MVVTKYVVFILLMLYDVFQIKTDKTNNMISYILRFILCLQLGDKYFSSLLLLGLFREYIYGLLKKDEKELTPIIYKAIPMSLIIMTFLIMMNFYTNAIQVLICMTFVFTHYYKWFYEGNSKKLHSCDFITNLICIIYCITYDIILLVIEYVLMCCISFHKYRKVYKTKFKTE